MIAHLPRSAPSAHGVDSSGILRFLDAVDSAGVDFHSLMVLRNGHVVAEGWWAPYSAEDITRKRSPPAACGGFGYPVRFWRAGLGCAGRLRVLPCLLRAGSGS